MGVPEPSVFRLPSDPNTRSSSARNDGNCAFKSLSNGNSARTRAMSARFTVAVTIASSKIGARTRTSPRGPTTIDPPWNIRPPSLPTRFTSAA